MSSRCCGPPSCPTETPRLPLHLFAPTAEQRRVAEHVEPRRVDASVEEQQQVRCRSAPGDIALRVLPGNDHRAGLEAHEPLAISVGGVQMHRLTRTLHIRRAPPEGY